MPYIGKSPELGVRTRYYYTVSAGATSVSGSDDNSKSLTFSDGEYVDVYLNGVSLVAGTDYNTTTANTIAGLSAMSANDVVEVVVYDVFSVFSGDISGDLSVGGNLTGADGGALSVGADLTVTGAIKSASGNQTITPDGTSDLIINSDRIKLVGAEGESATLLLGADEQDDAGDSWSIVNGTDNVLSFKNDKSGSSDVTHLSITPHATVTSSVVNVEGILSVAPTSATMVASGQFAVVKEGGSAIAEINSYRNAVGGSALILSHSRGTSQGSYTVLNDNDQMGRITWQGADGSDLVTEGAQIHAEIDGTPGSNDLPTALVFSTTIDGASSITERMRISNSGGMSMNNNANENACAIHANSTSMTSQVLSLEADRNTSDSTYRFIGAHRIGVATVFNVYDDGDVTNANNSYGSTSDEKLKENIADASSQWDDIKALKVRKFSFKADKKSSADKLGVIAQEVEAAGMNGLVTEVVDDVRDENKFLEDGKTENPEYWKITGKAETTTKQVKYSILYMKAVKALQEAMTRIETLETKVKALEDA